MDLLYRLRGKYRDVIERKAPKSIKRWQFNMMVAGDSVLVVKLLAAILKVPRYVITEHLLQVGTYYVLMAARDQGKREKLASHLIKVHLLGTDLTDDEEILRLGED